MFAGDNNELTLKQTEHQIPQVPHPLPHLPFVLLSNLIIDKEIVEKNYFRTYT